MEWVENLTVSQQVGLIGGLIGTLIGLAGAAVALRNSLKHARSSADRRRMGLAFGGMFSFVAAFLVTVNLVPGSVRPWLFVLYVVLLWILIHATNKYAFQETRRDKA